MDIKCEFETATLDVPVDDQGRANLTEAWKRAGRPKGKTPSRYKALKRARAVMELARWFVRRGRNASTWAANFVALDYAAYLGVDIIATPTTTADGSPHHDPDAHVDGKTFDEWLAEKKATRDERRREHEESMARLQEIGDAIDASRSEDEAGKEWKQDAEPGYESWDDSDRDEDADDTWVAGDDRLFMEWINLPGALRIRASIN